MKSESCELKEAAAQHSSPGAAYSSNSAATTGTCLTWGLEKTWADLQKLTLPVCSYTISELLIVDTLFNRFCHHHTQALFYSQ